MPRLFQRIQSGLSCASGAVAGLSPMIRTRRARGKLHHRIGGMVRPENVIQIALPQVAIVHSRGDGKWALRIGGNLKLVAHQCGTAGLYGVVIGHGVNGPDFVVVHEFAVRIDGPVGEAMRALVEHAVGLQEAAVIDLFAGGILTRNSTQASYRSRTSGISEWPMFLFWMTTIICTMSFGASLNGAEPSGAIMLLIAVFLMREQIDIQIVAGSSGTRWSSAVAHRSHSRTERRCCRPASDAKPSVPCFAP